MAAQNFLSNLSDQELIFDTKEAIANEREAISIVIKYFAEIKKRELYLKAGYSSLFAFVTEHLGYCNASAQSRINAMELIKSVPEVEKKIESGELSLTAAARVQTFFNAEKKTKKTYSTPAKLELIEQCLKKSTREVERELAKRNPDVANYETCRPVGQDRFELKLVISEELEAKIRKLKSLLAHSEPGMKTAELFERLVELGLEKHDPARAAARAEKRKAAQKVKVDSKTEIGSGSNQKLASEVPAQKPNLDTPLRAHEVTSNSGCETQLRHPARPAKPSRSIPAAFRHQIWLMNEGQGCAFTDTRSGKRCGSRHAMQVDHIVPFSRGGTHEIDNLRVVCAQHNRLLWREHFARTNHVREASVAYA